jgi:hypothetical protein
MRTSIALDDTGDFLTGQYPTGHTTFAICSGAELVVQSVKVGLSVGRGDIWYNLAYGVDKQNLFFNPSENDEFLAPMRAIAIREFLQSFEYVVGLDGEPSFARDGRILSIAAPCIILDCASSAQRITIGEVNAC